MAARSEVLGDVRGNTLATSQTPDIKPSPRPRACRQALRRKSHVGPAPICAVGGAFPAAGVRACVEARPRPPRSVPRGPASGLRGGGGRELPWFLSTLGPGWSRPRKVVSPAVYSKCWGCGQTEAVRAFSFHLSPNSLPSRPLGQIHNCGPLTPKPGRAQRSGLPPAGDEPFLVSVSYS